MLFGLLKREQNDRPQTSAVLFCPCDSRRRRFHRPRCCWPLGQPTGCEERRVRDDGRQCHSGGPGVRSWNITRRKREQNVSTSAVHAWPGDGGECQHHGTCRSSRVLRAMPWPLTFMSVAGAHCFLGPNYNPGVCSGLAALSGFSLIMNTSTAAMNMRVVDTIKI